MNKNSHKDLATIPMSIIMKKYLKYTQQKKPNSLPSASIIVCVKYFALQIIFWVSEVLLKVKTLTY